jgi:3-deoxy-manno-octulosonate cytidylyltransferase (CMP-KDO synthetase)
MIQHVWERACDSDAARVIIATDNETVFEACRHFGADVRLTREDHPSGTDRLQEVVEALSLPADAIVVNVQGDEPLIPPQVINQVAHNLQSRPEAGMATLAEPLVDVAQLHNKNVVKIALDASGYALYFSRAAIPWARDELAAWPERLPDNELFLRHIGIYAYRAELLNAFVNWPPGRLEQLEKLEQLRALEQGVRIHVERSVALIPAGVDTLDDLEAVRAIVGQGSAP